MQNHITQMVVGCVILFTEEFVTSVQFCKQTFLFSIAMCCHIYILGRKKTAKPELGRSV